MSLNLHHGKKAFTRAVCEVLELRQMLSASGEQPLFYDSPIPSSDFTYTDSGSVSFAKILASLKRPDEPNETWNVEVVDEVYIQAISKPDFEGVDSEVRFRVTRFNSAADMQGDLTVLLYPPDGTAIPGDDYSNNFPSQVIVPEMTGSTTSQVEFSVSLIDDELPEWTETIIGEIQPSGNYTVKYGPAVAEIVDDDLTLSGLPSELWVNNDDDNQNNVMDKDETGSVSDEDDLVPMSLDVPQDVVLGATVTLTAPNSLVRIYENDDRSGTKYITSTSSSFTWTYGVDPLPPDTVWVEAIAGSVSVDDIVIAIADTDATAAAPPTTSTTLPNSPATTQAATQKTTNRGLQLTLDGNPIPLGGNNGNVVVGQRINLSASPLGPAAQLPPIYNWVIPDKAIKAYLVVANIPNIFPPSLHTASTDFVWVDAGAKQVQVTIPGLGDATTNFTVLRPTVTPLVSTNPVAVDSNFGGLNLPYLHLGDGNKTTPATAGIYLKAPALPAGFQGDYQWVQTLKVDRSEHRIADNKWYDADLEGLDTQYPADSGDKTGDSPGKRLDSAVTDEVHVNDTFKTLLMFRPNTPGAEWVPLNLTTWTFAGKATWNGNVWNPVAGSLQGPAPASADSTDYLTWSSVVTGAAITAAYAAQ